MCCMLVKELMGEYIKVDSKLEGSATKVANITDYIEQRFFLCNPSQEDPQKVATDKVYLNYIDFDGEIDCTVKWAELAMTIMNVIKFYKVFVVVRHRKKGAGSTNATVIMENTYLRVLTSKDRVKSNYLLIMYCIFGTLQVVVSLNVMVVNDMSCNSLITEHLDVKSHLAHKYLRCESLEYCKMDFSWIIVCKSRQLQWERSGLRFENLEPNSPYDLLRAIGYSYLNLKLSWDGAKSEDTDIVVSYLVSVDKDEEMNLQDEVPFLVKEPELLFTIKELRQLIKSQILRCNVFYYQHGTSLSVILTLISRDQALRDRRETVLVRMEAMETFPQDVVVNILSRLPVK
ncbi:hypothetical protein GQ457_05G016090 [Hibiscus cannabinus]